MLSNFFKKINRAFSIPTLRSRLFFTFLMFIVVRIGVHIPLPGVDLYKLKAISQNSFIDFVNLISGGAVSNASIFSLTIVPYINASIMIYVLTLMYPKLDEMNKEGGKEKAKLTQWTRYITLLISIIYSISGAFLLQSRNLVENPGVMFFITTIFILTASVTFLTWIGDQISANGIGNGISLIIFLGIVSRLPSTIIQIFRRSSVFNLLIIELIGVSVVTMLLIMLIVAFQMAVRKIPVFYASGKGQSVANRSELPIKINNTGVMPIIFASVIASVPNLVISFLPESWDIKIYLSTMFSSSNFIYHIFYFFLVLFFTFFYTSVIFDPEKIAENLRKSGASISGVRPGLETIRYLERIIVRITFGGAIFLAIIAVLPYLLSNLLGSSFNIGGTGIIISVGVAIETIQQIEGALAVEEYERVI
jgi:preprotein translocase subunit SecY